MALTYKTDVITLNAANTDFTILTASASSTLVKNISWIHDDHNTNIILSITKSGGSKISIGEYAATANTSTKIWTDVLPLGANDVLHLQSDHISGTDLGYCVISYVEDTANVAGQSIGVHTDVSISGITDGQVLEWNNSTTQFEPATVSGGATDTDGLSEGSTNLYYTEARVAANSAVTANTAKAGITTQQASDIITNNAKTGITSGQASAITTNTAKTGITSTQASDITANNAKTGITSGQASAITANTAKVGITSTQASEITANTAKVGITTQQASDITTNNAKVGITSTQASDITANNAKVGITSGQASAITANTAKVGITTQQAADITANNAKIATVVDDTSPQLGGNLDVQAHEIETSTTNGNIIVAPNGTGVFEVKGDTNDGAIQLNCNQNSHGVKIQSPPHSAAASYTLVLPDDTGTNGQVMTTDGSGNLSFTTVSGGGTNTNLGNANLTADNNRTLDMDGNNLTIDNNGGEFTLKDSGTSDTYITAGSNELGLGDAGMVVNALGTFRAAGGIEQDEAGLTTAGAYGDGADITFLGSSATSVLTGKLYYYSGATWVFYTSATEAPQKALLGVAIGTTMSRGFLLKGFVNPNGATGFTAGAPVFGATNASITSTIQTAYQRIMGHAISGTVIYFNPSAEYIDLT